MRDRMIVLGVILLMLGSFTSDLSAQTPKEEFVREIHRAYSSNIKRFERRDASIIKREPYKIKDGKIVPILYFLWESTSESASEVQSKIFLTNGEYLWNRIKTSKVYQREFLIINNDGFRLFANIWRLKHPHYVEMDYVLPKRQDYHQLYQLYLDFNPDIIFVIEEIGGWFLVKGEEIIVLIDYHGETTRFDKVEDGIFYYLNILPLLFMPDNVF